MTKTCSGALTRKHESVEKPTSESVPDFVLPLSLGDLLRKSNRIVRVGLAITVDDDVGDHGQLAGLYLEVAH